MYRLGLDFLQESVMLSGEPLDSSVIGRTNCDDSESALLYIVEYRLWGAVLFPA
jgi:hypothetical protein